MIYKVQLLAFVDEPLIREVNVPDQELIGLDLSGILERIFYYGQNDFQPVHDRYSVSVGDVAEVDGKLFIVRGVGWGQITPEQLEAYKKLDRRDRQFCKLTHPTLALVVYELDSNGEANGTIHPYCNHGCFDSNRAALRDDIVSRHFRPEEKVVEARTLPADTVCENCHKPIKVKAL